MRHDAEDSPQPAVYLDLQLPLPKISLFLHEWLKLSGTLPPTLCPVRVLTERGDQTGTMLMPCFPPRLQIHHLPPIQLQYNRLTLRKFKKFQ